MEGEIDPDFDPTTEEGQEDINDDIDENYPLLQKGDDEDVVAWYRRMRDKFGDRVSYAIRRMGDLFRTKNPNKSLPEYMELENLDDPRIEMRREMVEDVRQRFPNMKEALLDFEVGADGQARVKYHNKKTWYDLYLKRSTKVSSKLSKEIKEALGKETLTDQLQNVENELNELQTEQDREQEQREEIQRQIETAAPEEVARLRQQLSEKDAEIARLSTTIDNARAEKQQILQQTAVLEERLRQTTQAIEDLEHNINEKQQIINDLNRPEEERTAAERELQELQERLEELHKQRENLERELGLTTKEKIKRALLKYGIPAAFAVAISSVIGVILTSLKGVGAGVKKIGQGLTALGKKMAAAVPGLLGSVLSLVLKTGGELLKFVGNNIWILVVAIGAVLLKKLKI